MNETEKYLFDVHGYLLIEKRIASQTLCACPLRIALDELQPCWSATDLVHLQRL